MILSNKLAKVLLDEKLVVKVNGIEYEVYVRKTPFCLESEADGIYDGVDDDQFDYFCYNKNNKITCWPKARGKQPLSDSGKWKLEGRQEIKPGRFFLLFEQKIIVVDPQNRCRIADPYDGVPPTEEKKELRAKIIARTAEIFAARVKGANEELDYLISSDIAAIYQTKHHELSNYLANSCMRKGSDHDCRLYPMFYNFIPNLKVIYGKREGKLLYRALLWENIKVAVNNDPTKLETRTFLDRVYGPESVVDGMREIAKEKGWLRRSFGKSDIIDDASGKIVVAFTELPKEAIKYLATEGGPYMDTLYNFAIANGIYFLTNVDDSDESGSFWDKNNNGKHWAEIQSCSGGTFYMPKCQECAEEIPDNPVVLKNRIFCPTCAAKVSRTCAHCGEFMLKEDVIICADDGKEYCSHCCSDLQIYRCAICGEYHFKKEMERTENNDLVCKRCALKLSKCAVCGGLLRENEECELEINGKTLIVCHTCVNNRPVCSCCGKHLDEMLLLTTSPQELLCTDCKNFLENMQEGVSPIYFDGKVWRLSIVPYMSETEN